MASCSDAKRLSTKAAFKLRQTTYHAACNSTLTQREAPRVPEGREEL